MNRRPIGIILAGLLLIGLVLIAHEAIQRQLRQAAVPAPAASPSPTVSPTATPAPLATPTETAIPKPTVPVAPAATPIPPTPTPTPGPIVTNDKLGVGIYSNNITINTMRVFRPALILIQDPDPNTTHIIRENFPRALIVGRRFVPDGDAMLAHCTDPKEDHYAKGVAFADFVSRIAVPLKGIVDAWVSDNEQATSAVPSELPCHAQFQTGFIEQLQGKYGIAAVAGNDASAAVEPSDYPKYFAKPISEATYFGVHAYSKPEARTMQTADSQFYVLRYRLIHNELVKAGVPLPKGGFLLTETGIYEGWRGLVPDDKMAQDFIWLEQQTEQDAYVRGQFIFGLGMTGRFNRFELQGTNLIEQLGAFNAQHAGKP